MLLREVFTVVDWNCFFGWPEECAGAVVLTALVFTVLFVVLYEAANAPPADIESAAKATTDAHNIGESFMFSSCMKGRMIPPLVAK
jgi:hypothetical protein